MQEKIMEFFLFLKDYRKKIKIFFEKYCQKVGQ